MLTFSHRTRRRAFRHDIPGLHAWVTWSRRSGLQLHGHHLMRGGSSPYGDDVEYEYLICLTEAEQWRLAELLGVRRPSRLVVVLTDRSAEVMAAGELRWLRDLLGPDAATLVPSLRCL